MYKKNVFIDFLGSLRKFQYTNNLLAFNQNRVIYSVNGYKRVS